MASIQEQRIQWERNGQMTHYSTENRAIFVLDPAINRRYGYRDQIFIYCAVLIMKQYNSDELLNDSQLSNAYGRYKGVDPTNVDVISLRAAGAYMWWRATLDEEHDYIYWLDLTEEANLTKTLRLVDHYLRGRR